MNALFFTFLSACFASMSNLFFRKSSAGVNLKANSNSNGYIAIYFFVSFLFSLIICHGIWTTSPRLPVIVLGSCVGMLNIALMWLISKALNSGPAGLTFAFQNLSSIFPGMLLFMIFGQNFGFAFSAIQFIGILLVMGGLFIGTKNKDNTTSNFSGKWIKYALGCFFIQLAALTFMQGRCILIDCENLHQFSSIFSYSQAEDVWFMPVQFASAFILQLGICLYQKAAPQKVEIFYGSLAGFTNAGSTILLLLATQVADPAVSAILFPCFAVSAVVLCNIWAKKIYQENFNIPSNAMCALGVIIGSIPMPS